MPRAKNPAAAPARKRAPRKAATPPDSKVAYPNFVDPQQRAALIAKAAYYLAMHRGFVTGHEEADWLAAEAEVDAELMRGSPATPGS